MFTCINTSFKVYIEIVLCFIFLFFLNNKGRSMTLSLYVLLYEMKKVYTIYPVLTIYFLESIAKAKVHIFMLKEKEK